MPTSQSFMRAWCHDNRAHDRRAIGHGKTRHFQATRCSPDEHGSPRIQTACTVPKLTVRVRSPAPAHAGPSYDRPMPQSGLVAEVGAVDWRSLKSTYGSGEVVRDIVLGLASSDETPDGIPSAVAGIHS
jgi:hypothetical protein